MRGDAEDRTRRVACSTVKNTYNLLRANVSNWNRSHATIPSACAVKNCDHVGPDRLGAGSRP